MRHAAYAAALFFALTGLASAQTAPPAAIGPSENASRDPAEAPAGAYTLDARHASVVWRVRHIGLGLYTARFDTVSGTLNFDPQNVSQSSVNVTIAANSVSTGLRNREGALAFDGEIANVLGADEHPQITFVSRSILQTGPAAGLITGDLTLNGRTHPVTLEASFHGGRRHPLNQRYVLAFSARTIIDRTQWDAGSLIFNQFAGDDVEILIDAEFIKDE